MTDSPKPGLYESLITARLEARLAELNDRLTVGRGDLHRAEAANRVALHLGETGGKPVTGYSLPLGETGDRLLIAPWESDRLCVRRAPRCATWCGTCRTTTRGKRAVMPKDGIGPELSCEMCSLSPLFPVTAFRTAFREGGKIVETWVTWDNMAIFGQLGISPCPEEADEG